MVPADRQSVRAHVQELFQEQVERARGERTAPNEPAPGDAAARNCFWELLSAPEQRLVFLKAIGDRQFWPRVRTLVGAPPFEFLLRSDEGVLNPSGIGARRKHMAHDEEVVTPYGSFCRGHYEDSLGRLYKIISRRKAPRAEPWEPLTSGDMVVVDVRLHRHNFRKKLELLRGDHGSVAQAAAQFPKPGSSVRLRRTAAFDAIEGMGGADQEVRLAVRNGRIPKPGGVVARLVADVE